MGFLLVIIRDCIIFSKQRLPRRISRAAIAQGINACFHEAKKAPRKNPSTKQTRRMMIAVKCNIRRDTNISTDLAPLFRIWLAAYAKQHNKKDDFITTVALPYWYHTTAVISLHLYIRERRYDVFSCHPQGHASSTLASQHEINLLVLCDGQLEHDATNSFKYLIATLSWLISMDSGTMAKPQARVLQYQSRAGPWQDQETWEEKGIASPKPTEEFPNFVNSHALKMIDIHFRQ